MKHARKTVIISILSKAREKQVRIKLIARLYRMIIIRVHEGAKESVVRGFSRLLVKNTKSHKLARGFCPPSLSSAFSRMT